MTIIERDVSSPPPFEAPKRKGSIIDKIMGKLLDQFTGGIEEENIVWDQRKDKKDVFNGPLVEEKLSEEERIQGQGIIETKEENELKETKKEEDENDNNMCEICYCEYESNELIKNICGDNNCNSKFCTTCLGLYFGQFVKDSFHGACKKMICANDECERIVTRKTWKEWCGPEIHQSFQSYAKSLLAIKCGSCHKASNLMVDYVGNEQIREQVKRDLGEILQLLKYPNEPIEVIEYALDEKEDTKESNDDIKSSLLSKTGDVKQRLKLRREKVKTKKRRRRRSRSRSRSRSIDLTRLTNFVVETPPPIPPPMPPQQQQQSNNGVSLLSSVPVNNNNINTPPPPPPPPGNNPVLTRSLESSLFENDPWEQLAPPLVSTQVKVIKEDIMKIINEIENELIEYQSGGLNEDDVLNKIFNTFESSLKKSTWESFTTILKPFLSLMSDDERRATLHLRYIYFNPKISTTCCSRIHCFRCKKRDFHEGQTCAEYQAGQTTQNIVTCPSCNIFCVKGDGCASLHCVCGATWNWSSRLTEMRAIQGNEFVKLFPNDTALFAILLQKQQYKEAIRTYNTWKKNNTDSITLGLELLENNLSSPRSFLSSGGGIVDQLCKIVWGNQYKDDQEEIKISDDENSETKNIDQDDEEEIEIPDVDYMNLRDAWEERIASQDELNNARSKAWEILHPENTADDAVNLIEPLVSNNLMTMHLLPTQQIDLATAWRQKNPVMYDSAASNRNIILSRQWIDRWGTKTNAIYHYLEAERTLKNTPSNLEEEFTQKLIKAFKLTHGDEIQEKQNEIAMERVLEWEQRIKDNKGDMMECLVEAIKLEELKEAEFPYHEETLNLARAWLENNGNIFDLVRHSRENDIVKQASKLAWEEANPENPGLEALKVLRKTKYHPWRYLCPKAVELAEEYYRRHPDIMNKLLQEDAAMLIPSFNF